MFYGSQIVYSDKKLVIDKKKLNFFRSLKNCRLYSELPHDIQTIKANKPICLIHSKSKKKQILRENLEKISYKILRNLY